MAWSRFHSFGSIAMTLPGAGDHRALQRTHADAADADDHHRLTGLHLCDVGGRAVTGRHRAAHDGGGLERDVLIDLDDRVLVHGHVRREGAEQVHRRHLGGARVHPAGSVRDGLAAEQHRAAITQRPVALQARLTRTAGGDEGEDDVVALVKAGDVLADLGDDARALVPTECGQADRGGSGGQVVVRVAHACGMHADLHLIVDGVADLDLVDPER